MMVHLTGHHLGSMKDQKMALTKDQPKVLMMEMTMTTVRKKEVEKVIEMTPALITRLRQQGEGREISFSFC